MRRCEAVFEEISPVWIRRIKGDRMNDSKRKIIRTNIFPYVFDHIERSFRKFGVDYLWVLTKYKKLK